MRIPDMLASPHQLVDKQVTLQGRIANYDAFYCLAPVKIKRGNQFILIDIDGSDEKTAHYIQSLPRRRLPYMVYITGVLRPSTESLFKWMLTDIQKIFMAASDTVNYVECYSPDITYDSVQYSKLPAIDIGDLLTNLKDYMGHSVRISGYITQISHNETYIAMPEYVDAGGGGFGTMFTGVQAERQHAILIDYDNLLSKVGIGFPNFGGRSFGESGQIVGTIATSSKAPFPAMLVNVSALALKTMYGCITVWDCT